MWRKLDQHNLKQHHRAYAWPTVVLAVQILYKFVYLFESDRCVDLPQQVPLRDHIFQTYKSILSSIFAFFTSFFITLYHYTAFFSPIREKRPPSGDLFRQAVRPPKRSGGPFLRAVLPAGRCSQPGGGLAFLRGWTGPALFSLQGLTVAAPTFFQKKRRNSNLAGQHFPTSVCCFSAADTEKFPPCQSQQRTGTDQVRQPPA